jgi:hypothetical protein
MMLLKIRCGFCQGPKHIVDPGVRVTNRLLPWFRPFIELA